jgi:hypothetical protein
MAHFAELDENNEVVIVLTGNDNDDERELSERTGKTYKKCSYNTIAGIHRLGGTPFRKNYPSPGCVYDAQRDAFIPKGPYGNWIPKVGEAYPEDAIFVLNENTCLWQIDIEKYPYPNGSPFVDEEEKQSWHWDMETSTWITLEESLHRRGIVLKREE